MTVRGLLLMLAFCSGVAFAAEPGAVPVPSAVTALAGCWSGHGVVMGKPVTVMLNAHRLVLGAMMALDIESAAMKDPADRYAAHLLIGGASGQAAGGAPLAGVWTDSFGGTLMTMGRGQTTHTGFVLTYPYPDASFLNQWYREGARLDWTIQAVSSEGRKTAFARYSLSRKPCPAAGW